MGRPKKEKVNAVKEANLCPTCAKKGVKSVMTQEGDVRRCAKCQHWAPLKAETNAEKKARLQKEIDALDADEKE